MNKLLHFSLQATFVCCTLSAATGQDLASNQGKIVLLKTPEKGMTQAKTLRTALSELEVTYKVSIMADQALIEGKTITEARTYKNLEDALKNLLKETDLKYEKISKNFYVITPLTGKKQNQIKEINHTQTEESQTGTSGMYLPALQKIAIARAITLREKAIAVSGKVTSETKEGIPGVNVLLKGTNSGTTTNGEGNYTLTIPDGNGTLVFSYIGYTTEEVPINGRTTIDIALVPDVQSLTEVVVVGYGTQKKSDLTGSVTSVKSAEINSFPIANPVQGLQGRAAGVQVMQNSGQPGASLSVRIRGGNSLRGSNEPLYVVDGFPLTGSPASLNPNDIESMEVLKDASATAIYGSRGANGVVIITTKRGKSGKSQVDIDSYYGVQSVIRKIPLLNAREFAEVANERALNDGVTPYFTQEQIDSFGEGTDWQDEIFRTAPIQNHSLTFSGGTDKIQYSVSGNYLGQKGIILGSGYQKGTLRANVNSQVSEKFSFNFSSILSRTSRNLLNSDFSSRGNGLLSAALVAPPTITPYDANGNYSNVVPYAFSPNVLQNPLAWALERKEENLQDYILVNTGVTYEFIPGLSLRVSAGIEDFNSRGDYYSTRKLPTTPNGAASVSTNRRTNFLNENILTYTRSFADVHSLIFTGGITYQSDITRSFSSSATGFANDVLENNAMQTGSFPGIPTTSTTDWTLLSSLARVNYALKGRYLLTASMRADGSSRFGRNNRWGYFPSVAFAWRVIEEPFMQNLSAFSDLKLRTSWGRTGSTALDPYQTLTVLSSYQTIFNNDLAVGFSPGTQMPNPDLKWETTAQTNIGIDAGFFANRLTFTADYYLKNTSDLLAIVPLPPATGYTNTIQNIGKIRNSGIELSLGSTLFDGPFKWDVSANFSANRNEVLKLAGGSDVFGSALPIPFAVPVNLVREGLPVGVFYGFEENGLNEKGEIVFKDLNGDNVINNDDRTVIGNPNPDFIYGFNSTASLKNFELTFFLQGVQGMDLFNFNTSGQANSFAFGENQIQDLYGNYWTAANPNPNAKYPKLSVNTKFRESDRYVEDGSYLRLRNIVLAYNLPTADLGIKWLRNAQVYVSGQNLLTFTRYTWYDPEVNTYGGGASITLGVDQAGYPSARTVTGGIRIGL
jgi:TonB-linked SusC/RagA family outer membrane protein